MEAALFSGSSPLIEPVPSADIYSATENGIIVTRIELGQLEQIVERLRKDEAHCTDVDHELTRRSGKRFCGSCGGRLSWQ
jgi:NADH pyrophosphatase NudC (nudix superfamily)